MGFQLCQWPQIKQSRLCFGRKVELGKVIPYVKKIQKIYEHIQKNFAFPDMAKNH